MISAVILAAGLSSRMMDFKPLLPFGGSTVIQHTVSRLLEGGAEDIVLVTGFLAPEIEKRFSDPRIRFVHNQDYARSQMFDSARLGLAAARGDDIFLLPADLPQFSPELLEQMRAVRGQAVYPVCGGKNGHPLLLRRESLNTIFRHDGTRGLKGALDRLETRTLETEDPGCLMDIDTPEDYWQLCSFRWAGLPTEGEKAEIFRMFETSDRVRLHCEAVRCAALSLAREIPGIDLKMLETAAAIHDAARSRKNHPEVLANELERRGYGRLASIVRVHMELPDSMAETVDEASLLYLADKLVLEDQYVGIEERFRRAELRFRNQPEILREIQRKRAAAQTILAKVHGL